MGGPTTAAPAGPDSAVLNPQLHSPSAFGPGLSGAAAVSLVEREFVQSVRLMHRGGAPEAPWDEDSEGDLGHGTRTRTRTSAMTEGPRSLRSPSPGATWSPQQSLSPLSPDLNKEQLKAALKESCESVALLHTELEAAHRYLQGKYAALKILQGQSILDKATTHTKNLLHKSEERSKNLEKEVNSLQWELSLSQLRLHQSELAFEKNFYRMLTERNSLAEELKQTQKEREELRAENQALSQECADLRSRLGLQSREQEAEVQY